ncbi:class III lanthipeptide [Saccharothrix coeruleofusca]|nr:class III lanthipeptide [Saccharothrix coeruleofusca]MBP2335620.1 hypothetical protein [Saccharothrix coeruleofusca]
MNNVLELQELPAQAVDAELELPSVISLHCTGLIGA